ncbi:ribosome-associated translation inhibitor RaiA [Candidatus Babeliales bacterium]|nr:ribosome-associated translation inhibitor RaiA [Candidatus Babeliales bacterium]MBP9844318.1 ribosome-associated translation inhibitor RaiA [Candidatus Babeliales bacterium]
MHKRITFRSMARSEAIEKYIQKRIEKITKFFKREPQPIFMDVVLEPHREKHFFKVEFKVNTSHYNFIVQTEGLDMYMMIDNAISKMIKDITRRKERLGHDLHLSYI